MNNKLLEQRLGVPFFDSLQAIAKLRVQTLSDSQAAGYISAVLNGLAERHPWLDDDDDFMFDFAKAACGYRLDSIASCANDEVSNQVFLLAIDDLLTALGRNERIYQHSGDLVFSRDDMLALDEVWRMDKFNCGEMAERMHRFEK